MFVASLIAPPGMLDASLVDSLRTLGEVGLLTGLVKMKRQNLRLI